ncbi:MAG: hypothetical protein LQ351_004523 [Letrouitia transgressa]|nr:MAG: hypothetical protein LQ351_004523 [Letrouitia transgressa]
MTKAKSSDINHASPINGLTPMHFAVLWPEALKTLIERGANINKEDQYGRRPIHLAVALGLTRSVDCLLGADCALFTPPIHRSLLQHALLLDESERRYILDALIAALTDRHTRLIDRARSHLPSIIFSKFNIVEGHKKERRAPWIREVLLSRGFIVPKALELDNKSVYDVTDMHERLQMTNDVADALWNAGFEDINEPNEYGLTPLLQNWSCADFPMIAWFVKMGVSLSSRRRDDSLSGLHLYASPLVDPGPQFLWDPELIPTDEQCIAQIQKEMGIPYDECTCPCSPNGCYPIKPPYRALSCWPGSRRDLFRIWLKKVKPELRLLQQYVLEFTRCLLFDFLGCRHTCCNFGQFGIREIKISYKSDSYIHGEYTSMGDLMFQNDRLPRPRNIDTLTENAELLERELKFYMSKYNEMPRPETMLPEEQPFHYVCWVVERYEANWEDLE